MKAMSMVLCIAVIGMVAGLVHAYFRGRSRLKAKALKALQNAYKVPAGSVHRSVFTYDGRPIKKQPKGKQFRVLVLKGERTMTSVHTGTSWTDDCCLSFEGERIGFLGGGIYHDLLSSLVNKYGSASIVVHIKGYDANAGFPYVVADLPDLDWLRDAVRK